MVVVVDSKDVLNAESSAGLNVGVRSACGVGAASRSGSFSSKFRYAF